VVDGSGGGHETLREIFLLGPTASGKDRTAALLAHALSQRGVLVEVICMDSMKVYQGLEITTDAPTREDRALARFHMVGIVPAREPFSTGAYVAHARQVEQEVRSRGALPLWSGGTTLYYRALVDGLFEGPGAHPEVRKHLERAFASLGAGGLHHALRAVDPGAARTIHPRDRLRIVRALEVFLVTGRPLSQQATSWSQGPGAAPAPGRRVLGIFPPWEELQRRIEERAGRILSSPGALSELEELQRQGVGLSRQASHALGVREALAVLEGRCTREEAVQELARRTRRLARAQRTWFRSLSGVEWHLLETGCESRETVSLLLETLEGPPGPAPATF
jgi:tRNA dimethylallyltransferase